MRELKKSINALDRDVLSLTSYNIRIGLNLLLGIIITAIATIGFQNNLGLTFYTHPLVFTILFFVITIGAEILALRSSNIGIIYLCYCIICLAIGALLSSTVPYFSMDQIVFAAGSAFLILLLMVVLAAIIPDAFISMGKGLFIALLSFIIVELLMLLFTGTSHAFMDYIVILIFSLYIGYDWARGSVYPKNNKFAILTALSIYMDVINIFIRILSRSSSSND